MDKFEKVRYVEEFYILEMKSGDKHEIPKINDMTFKRAKEYAKNLISNPNHASWGSGKLYSGYRIVEKTTKIGKCIANIQSK